MPLWACGAIKHSHYQERGLRIRKKRQIRIIFSCVGGGKHQNAVTGTVFHSVIDPSTCRMGTETLRVPSVFDHSCNNAGCIRLQLRESESDLFWSKYSEKGRKKTKKTNQLTYLFMRAPKFGGEIIKKKCRMNLFIEQRTAKHHNKDAAGKKKTKKKKNTLGIRDISVGRDEKMFSEEKCPCGRQMPKQLWQRKKGGRYERTEGTTIIYVNNVPLLLIISGKIKQKRAGGVGGLGGAHHACHPTNFSHAN